MVEILIALKTAATSCGVTGSWVHPYGCSHKGNSTDPRNLGKLELRLVEEWGKFSRLDISQKVDCQHALSVQQ